MKKWDDGSDAYSSGKWVCECCNKEKMKMEGYNEIILCGKEMCRVLGVGLKYTWLNVQVRVRDVKITDDGKFKITVTDIDSTLVKQVQESIGLSDD